MLSVFIFCSFCLNFWVLFFLLVKFRIVGIADRILMVIWLDFVRDFRICVVSICGDMDKRCYIGLVDYRVFSI